MVRRDQKKAKDLELKAVNDRYESRPPTGVEGASQRTASSLDIAIGLEIAQVEDSHRVL